MEENKITFHDFALHEDLLSGIDAMGFRHPTPVQQQAVPAILEGKDLIACAQTGTGKTAAFLLPLLDKISHGNYDHTSTLVLVPTRELAKQIDDAVEGLAYFVSASSIAIYGGSKGGDWEQQKRALTSGADIIIATPGRLIAHMQLGYVKLDQLNYLVLDEADKMMDMGFMDDLLFIIRQLPKERQTLLFSATMPAKIRELSKRILQEPVELNLAISKPAANIDQRMFLTYDNQKLPLLEHLLKDEQVDNMIIFTSRKSNVITIVRALQKMGFAAEGIQSDKTQEEREEALRGFKNKKYQILVATDILSRGIDIEGLSHILNFDVPQDAEDYIHRIGRTARAGGSGVAITFVNEKDMYRVEKIERLIEREVPKLPLPEFLGEGPVYNPKPERGGKGGRNKNRSSGGRGRSGNKPQHGNRTRQESTGSAPRTEGNQTEAQQKPRPKKRYNRKPKTDQPRENKPE